MDTELRLAIDTGVGPQQLSFLGVSFQPVGCHPVADGCNTWVSELTAQQHNLGHLVPLKVESEMAVTHCSSVITDDNTSLRSQSWELSWVEPIFNSLVYRKTCSRKYVDFAMCDVEIFTSGLYVLLHFISPFQCICWELYILCSIVFYVCWCHGLRLSKKLLTYLWTPEKLTLTKSINYKWQVTKHAPFLCDQTKIYSFLCATTVAREHNKHPIRKT